MIPLIAAFFFVASAVAFVAFSQAGLLTSSPWAALAPNVVVDLFSLGVALLIAEVVIRRHRTNRGIKDLGPALLKTFAPALHADFGIIERLDYTPKEFKTLHAEYLEGKMDPIHLPADFKNRLHKVLSDYPRERIADALASLQQLKAFTSQFGGVLEPVHLLIVERADNTWRRFDEILKQPDANNTSLAESYMDAHDALTDVMNGFELDSVIEQMKRNG